MIARRHGPTWMMLGLLLTAAGCQRDPVAAARRYADSGDAYVRQGKDASALIQYRNAVRLEPSVERYRRISEVLERLGRRDEARQFAERAEAMADGSLLPDGEDDLRATIEKRPNEVPARLALSSRLIERGAVDEAEQQLRAALAIDPSRELTNRGLASLLISRGDNAEAETRLRAAAAARPQRHRSQLALADFLIGEERWPEATEVLNEAAEDAALRDQIALRRAVVADATGAGQLARSQLAEMLETQPSPEAWTLYAQFAFRDGRLTQSLDAANAALSLHPNFGPARALIEAIRWNQLRPVASSR